MNWDQDISKAAKETMKLLGNFGPTVNEQDRKVKGCMCDEEGSSKVYFNSDDLREMAAHFIEVAQWLDNRAGAKGEMR